MDSIPSGLAKSTLNIPKIKIHQPIPSDSVRRGPLAIVRSAALNDDINILRRFGEGSKPLFERDDVTVNQPTVGDLLENITSHDCKNSCKAKKYRSSSTESSSPERYRHRDTKKRSPSSSARRKSREKSSRDENSRHSHNRKYNEYIKNKICNTTKATERCDRRREKSKSRTPSSTRVKTTAEKLPYYRDEQRERDRRRRLYGRSRSRTPPSTSSRKYSPQLSRRRVGSPSRRRRSSSRDKNYSPYHSFMRYHRNRRSRTRSKSRSPSSRRDRERHKSHYNRERHKEQKDNSTLTTPVIAAPPPQIIPIAVPVPADYAYTFPGWTATPQASWHTRHHRPPTAPTHYAPFPMLPMMPPLRAAHRTPFAGLPPPLPYGPMPPGYRPHAGSRYNTPRHNNTHNSHARPKKSSN